MKKYLLLAAVLIVGLVIYATVSIYNSGPSESSVEHGIAALSAQPSKLKDWLTSEHISFSSTKAPKSFKGETDATVYTLNQFGFTPNDLVNASEILDFSIWTRQELTLGRPFLRYMLIYDSSGNLLFKRSMKLYEFL